MLWEGRIQDIARVSTTGLIRFWRPSREAFQRKGYLGGDLNSHKNLGRTSMGGKSGQGPGTSMSKGHEPQKSLAVTELEEARVQSAECRAGEGPGNHQSVLRV